jgi:ribosomal protein S18 acetylase RimI-like enzyme
MSPIIRDFAPEYRAAVVDLSLRAWEPVFASIESVLRGSGVFALQYPDGWVPAQRSAVEHACDELRLWVAELDGAVVGFVAVRLHADDRMGEIHMVAVDPGRQRRGVGGALTRHALAWMAEQGMTTAMVETGGDPGHAPARAAYESAGFTAFPVARYFRTL